MSKKLTVSVLAILLVCTSLFAGCSKKGGYVDPVSGVEMEIVTDAEGNNVLSEDGELIVYTKDENGEYVTDENGENVTHVQFFAGQVESNGIVEDYAYKIKIPDGWAFIGDGKFKNKNETIEVAISISKYTSAKEKELNNLIAEGIKSNGGDSTIDETYLESVGADGTLFKMNSDKVSFSVASFVKEGNLFRVQAMANGAYDTDTVLNTFLSAITFKPYQYYDESELKDVTAAEQTTEADESTTAVTAAE